MNKQKILEALGFYVSQDNGVCYLERMGMPKSLSQHMSESEAWNSVDLDANFCFREIAPFVGSKGYSLRTGYDGAGYEAEIWDMRSMEPEDYEGFGSACDEENIETAILKIGRAS